MNERWLQARRRRPGGSVGLVLLLCGINGALSACAQTTATQTGGNINNPSVSPGALNNGTSIGPSEGVSNPPESSSH